MKATSASPVVVYKAERETGGRRETVGGVGGMGGTAASTTGVPHARQKRSSGSGSRPHLGHATLRHIGRRWSTFL